MRKLTTTTILFCLASLAMGRPAGAVTMATWHMDSLPPEQGRAEGSIDVVTGWSGKGYGFSGDDRIVWSGASNPGTSPFSAIVHVKTSKPPSSSIGDYDLIRKGLAGDGTYWKVELFPNSSYTKAFGYCQLKGTNAGAALKYTGADLADGAWHTIECHKTDHQVTLSVDGSVRVTKNVTLGNISNSRRLSIGAKPNVWQDTYIGIMDEVTYSIG
jgi:hypothetical protein